MTPTSPMRQLTEQELRECCREHTYYQCWQSTRALTHKLFGARAARAILRFEFGYNEDDESDYWPISLEALDGEGQLLPYDLTAAFWIIPYALLDAQTPYQWIEAAVQAERAQADRNRKAWQQNLLRQYHGLTRALREAGYTRALPTIAPSDLPPALDGGQWSAAQLEAKRQKYAQRFVEEQRVLADELVFAHPYVEFDLAVAPQLRFPCLFILNEPV